MPDGCQQRVHLVATSTGSSHSTQDQEWDQCSSSKPTSLDTLYTVAPWRQRIPSPLPAMKTSFHSYSYLQEIRSVAWGDCNSMSSDSFQLCNMNASTFQRRNMHLPCSSHASTNKYIKGAAIGIGVKIIGIWRLLPKHTSFPFPRLVPLYNRTATPKMGAGANVWNNVAVYPLWVTMVAGTSLFATRVYQWIAYDQDIQVLLKYCANADPHATIRRICTLPASVYVLIKWRALLGNYTAIQNHALCGIVGRCCCIS
jgi:hypothetical protein